MIYQINMQNNHQNGPFNHPHHWYYPQYMRLQFPNYPIFPYQSLNYSYHAPSEQFLQRNMNPQPIQVGIVKKQEVLDDLPLFQNNEPVVQKKKKLRMTRKKKIIPQLIRIRHQASNDQVTFREIAILKYYQPFKAPLYTYKTGDQLNQPLFIKKSDEPEGQGYNFKSINQNLLEVCYESYGRHQFDDQDDEEIFDKQKSKRITKQIQHSEKIPTRSDLSFMKFQQRLIGHDEKKVEDQAISGKLNKPSYQNRSPKQIQASLANLLKNNSGSMQKRYKLKQKQEQGAYWSAQERDIKSNNKIKQISHL